VAARSRGIFGLFLIGVGLMLVALNVRPSLEPVVLALTANHGVHLTDLVGAAVVYLGAALIWTRGRR
jgi:hypothetical protein